ncbi:MAG: PLP-dependent aminotransferase family protein [Betaproteobacteria bacterium]|nr:PLP-dependent aminotransferase family protein [Betaproteobacteria bacterium]
METAHASILYESVANDLSALIRSGTLGPGARVPSVRRMSRQRRVSIATVLQAYQLLENRGLIEARPQSGYYVRVPLRPVAEPAISKPPRSPQLVGVHALVNRVLESSTRADIIPLGAAIPSPELVPTAKLQRIVAGIARRQARSMAIYSLPPGREELRRQVALRARDWGVSLTADEVIITNGCIEAVNLCLRAVAKPGDVIALESPTYFGLLQIIESLGMKALEVPTHPRNGISLDALALAIQREKVKACIVMPNVSNPLGSTMPEAAKKRLVRMLAEHDIPLIEDSVYSALHFSPAPPFAAKAYDRKGMVMLCSSFTKTLAPGLRVGWVAPGRYHAQVQMLKFISSVGVSDLLQLTIAEFLENGGYERLLRALRRTYAHQLELVTHAVGRYFPRETKVTRPSGGYVLWVEMPAGVDSVTLYEQALTEGIGIAPGPMFSASNRYRNCLRVNCGIPWSERTERAIARIGALAHDLAVQS